LRREDHARPVVLLGYSYGAVAVLHAAARNAELTAVIADAAFVSHTDTLYRVVDYVRSDPHASLGDKIGIGFLKWPGVLWLAGVEFYLRTGVNLNGEKIDAIDAVPRIKDSPVLFLAGELDPIAPVCGAQRLLEATGSSQKKLVVLPGATHATFSKESIRAYEDAVLGFLHEMLPTDAPTGRSGE
jgi:pimeloyl-ACP methyl ester carboxylesterase